MNLELAEYTLQGYVGNHIEVFIYQKPFQVGPFIKVTVKKNSCKCRIFYCKITKLKTKKWNISHFMQE